LAFGRRALAADAQEDVARVAPEFELGGGGGD
jgi:hypothetical protein